LIVASWSRMHLVVQKAKVHYRFHKSPPWTIFWAGWIQSTPCFSKISLNIFRPYTFMCPTSSLTLRLLYAVPIPARSYFPSHVILLDWIVLIISRGKCILWSSSCNCFERPLTSCLRSKRSSQDFFVMWVWKHKWCVSTDKRWKSYRFFPEQSYSVEQFSLFVGSSPWPGLASPSLAWQL
jgi:hypothetical protein